MLLLRHKPFAPTAKGKVLRRPVQIQRLPDDALDLGRVQRAEPVLVVALRREAGGYAHVRQSRRLARTVRCQRTILVRRCARCSAG